MAVFTSGSVKLPTIGKDSFSDNDWGTIIKVCQMNLVPESWNVGDQKTMTINGTEYRVCIIGKNHDVYSDGTGKAPITFQLLDCYGTDATMNTTGSNAGGWGSSVMRTTHLPAILKEMPTEVQAAIREVNKATAVNSIINITSDKLFLLSQVEIVNSTPFSTVGEGTQYEYYQDGHTAVKRKAGAATPWYNRSPSKDNTTSFCGINVEGVATTFNASYVRSIAFAFCF